MRALALSTLVLLCACEPATHLEVSTGSDSGPAMAARRPPLPLTAGRYTFGPSVGKGFTGAPGPFAELTVLATGKVSVNWGIGCVVLGTTGTLAAFDSGALLDVDPRKWPTAEASEVEVSKVFLEPRPALLMFPAGLHVVATPAKGDLVTQDWNLVAAE
jgi:hypothetical protein